MRTILTLATALLASLAAAAPHLRGDAEAITAASVREHVAFLAADELAGRDTGTAEAMRAARYLAGALEEAGLEGAGDDGGFLQTVPLVRIVADGEPRVSGGDEQVFRHGEHFSIYRRPAARAADLRVVTVAEGDALPEPDAGIALDIDGSRRDARARLEAAGRAEGEGYGLIVLRGASSDGKPRGEVRSGGLEVATDDAGAAPAWIVARGALRTALEEGRLERLEFDGGCRLETAPAANVVARIPGAGTEERPELAREAIVLSAHYDHIGTRDVDPDDPDADIIFNGADDDASGVSCVVEVARALAAGPPPAREVIVLLATGEERGLLGTFYYLDHPATPLERTVCNLNVEMVGRPDALVGGAGEVWYTGPDETRLFEDFVAAGVDVSRDPYPEQNYYRRSDNYAFVMRGVIGQTFSTYDGHTDYHRPTDEVDTLDYDHLAAATRTVLHAVTLVANGAIDPAWAEGKGPPAPR